MRQRGLGITWWWELVYVEVAPWPGWRPSVCTVQGCGCPLHLLRLRVCSFVFGLFDCPGGPSALPVSLCGGHCGQEREKKAQSLGGTF
jgi:hypothetical protein